MEIRREKAREKGTKSYLLGSLDDIGNKEERRYLDGQRKKDNFANVNQSTLGLDVGKTTSRSEEQKEEKYETDH